MGLIYSIFAKLFGKKPIKVLMLGLYGAGKTTILYKIKLDKIVTTIPTIGFNLEKVEHKNISLEIWDVGGHTKTWKFYLAETDALIFVIDSSDRDVIVEAEQQIHMLLNEEALKNAVLLVFANKQDLSDSMSITELIDKLKLNTLNNRKWFIQASSATQGTGLYEGLDWLSTELNG